MRRLRCMWRIVPIATLIPLLLRPACCFASCGSSKRLTSIDTRNGLCRPTSPAHSILRCAIQTYCPDPAHPKVTSLTPPVPEHPLPPLIHHILTENTSANIGTVLQDYAGISEGLAQELLAFGAVYVAFPEQGSKNRHGVGKPRRTTVDEELPVGSYLRVHVNPKRHLRANEIDWASRIIDTTPEFVVVDKPAGVPTVPTVDNLNECVLSQVSKLVGENLLVTSRLDKCTSGVLVLARSLAACERMNRSLRTRRVDKVYRLLCFAPLACGVLRHLARHRGAGHKNSKPSLLRAFDASALDHPPAGRSGAEARNEWQLAELVVLSCSPLHVSLPPSPAPAPAVTPETPPVNANSQRAPGHPRCCSASRTLYECYVQLVTGRTHQVRLQVAASAGGVVGDSRYVPVAGQLHWQGETDEDAAPRGPGVQVQVPGPQPEDTVHRNAAGHGEAAEHLQASLQPPPFGPEPDVVALQAHMLRILPDDRDQDHHAPDPVSTQSTRGAPTSAESASAPQTLGPGPGQECQWAAREPWWASPDGESALAALLRCEAASE